MLDRDLWKTLIYEILNDNVTYRMRICPEKTLLLDAIRLLVKVEPEDVAGIREVIVGPQLDHPAPTRPGWYWVLLRNELMPRVVDIRRRIGIKGEPLLVRLDNGMFKPPDHEWFRAWGQRLAEPELPPEPEAKSAGDRWESI
jgi:hypothetical protein